MVKTKSINNIEIEGYEEALDTLEKYPNKINTIVKSAMRKAISPVLSDMKAKTSHHSFSKMVKYKFIKGTNPSIKFGFFGNKEGGERIGDVPNWFKAYWSNYGTLTRRYKGHTFVNPVKSKSKRIIGGVSPKLFFERATEGKDQAIYNDFVKNLQDGVAKLEGDKS